MSTNLTVNNNIFAYPDPGDEPGWGQAATGWASEVTTVLSSIQSADDILETSFSIANDTLSPLNIEGLFFNPVTVRGATIQYSFYRTTSLTELAEKGIIELVYKNGGTSGSKWTLSRSFVGDDAGVTISMTDAGQGQYISSNLSGTSYAGVIKFSAQAIAQ